MNSKKKIISTAALALMLSAGVAAAQSTYPTDTSNSSVTESTMTSTSTGGTTGTSPAVPNTGTDGSTTGTTGTSTGVVPGIPDTGAGGDVATTVLTLIASAFAALVGAVYLVTRKPFAR